MLTRNDRQSRQSTTSEKPAPPRILITDDDDSLRATLSMVLRREGYEADEASNGAVALRMLDREKYQLLITDVRMPEMDGMELLRRVREEYPQLPVIVMTAFDRREVGHAAVEAGAYDYFSKPLELPDLRITVRRALEHSSIEQEVNRLRQQTPSPGMGDIIGDSDAMNVVFEAVERVLDNDITVLIQGESGTGKEMVARHIHNNSPRKNAPFVAVNCAAIPEPLLESELFGHEKGAFTGAVALRRGKFEAANGGTIFLDEIGDMPPGLQAKILRVIQENEIVRVGGMSPIKVNVRLLAATHRNLEQMMAEGTFREDLFYRLNVYPVMLPPLRHRREDIPLLVGIFLSEANRKLNRSVDGFTPSALSCMENYDWPGNVRQLKNIVQRAVLLAAESPADEWTLPPEIVGSEAVPAPAPAPCIECIQTFSGTIENADELTKLFNDDTIPFQRKVEMLTEVLEKQLLAKALKKCAQKRQQTADMLGISRKTLYNKMKTYGMTDESDEG